MPRVFVLSGPSLGRSHAVDAGAVIGRGDDCDVALPEASVSRRHARVEADGAGGLVLVDLGSRNGLRVGGRRVERVALTDGTRVSVGKVELRFRLSGVARSEREEAPPPDAAPPDAATVPIELRPRDRTARRAAVLARVTAERGGLLADDLGQRPLWQRALVALVALGLAGGTFYAAFHLVQGLRAG